MRMRMSVRTSLRVRVRRFATYISFGLIDTVKYEHSTLLVVAVVVVRAVAVEMVVVMVFAVVVMVVVARSPMRLEQALGQRTVLCDP